MSPVFDVANRVRLVDIEDGRVTHELEHRLGHRGRVEELSSLGVDVLICSAISLPVEAMLWVAGIEVVSDICGPADDIIDAYRAGDRDLVRFRTPGHLNHTVGGRPHYAGNRRGTKRVDER